MFKQPNIYFLILLIGVGLFLVFLFYRRDTKIAKGLRTSSIILLIFLLVEPAFYRFVSRDKLAVLIDTSNSMGPKSDTLRWWLQRIDSLPVRKQYFWFDTTLYERNKGGGATDITKAIELLPSDIGSGILISDGIYTRGRDPSTVKFSLPIYSLPLEGRGLKDFRIADYRRNYYVYRGDTATLEAVIESEGLGGTNAWLTLMEDDREHAKIPVQLPPDGVRDSYSIEFIPESSGIHIYTLKIETEGRESDLSFPINVLDKRIRVLYISQSPSFNLKFIKLACEKDANIEFRSIIQLTQGSWLLGERSREAKVDIESRVREIEPDLVFVEGLGITETGGYIEDGGKCFLIGKDRYSPFIFGRRKDRESRVEFTQRELTITGEGFPELVFFDVIGIKRGARILAESPDIKSAQGNMPVFAVMGYGKGEIYSIASENLVPISFSPREDHLFWTRLIRWISKREEKIHIETDKVVYMSGDDIRITAETRDVIDEEIFVEIKNTEDGGSAEGYRESWYLYRKTPKRYEIIIDYLPPGRYEYTSKVGDRHISGEFYVEQPTPEKPTPYADRGLLSRLSLNSGGRVIHSPEEIQVHMSDEKLKSPLLPSKSPILLALIIVLLSIEWWYLRR